ncbi:MAG: DUF4381 domain-containing protein [Pseudohongiellaceae bacterium]|jgi:hypothetical protein
MDSEELLTQLADIHLPEPVGFWPPAPGWWVLAVLLLIAAVVAWRVYARQHARREIVGHALAELDRCYQRYAAAEASEGSADERKLRYVNEVNSVLRRVALVHFPGANAARLSGREWVDFIRENGDSSRLDDELAVALSYGRFQTRCDVNTEALYDLGKAWIRSLYTGNPDPSSDAEQ